MEMKEEKYETMLQKIREIKPVLEEPELFCNQIMDAVLPNPSNRIFKMVSLVRPWLAAASILLILLFIYQQHEDEKVEPVQMNTSALNKPVKTPACMDGLTLDLKNPPDFREMYKCYARNNRHTISWKEKLMAKYGSI